MQVHRPNCRAPQTVPRCSQQLPAQAGRKALYVAFTCVISNRLASCSSRYIKHSPTAPAQHFIMHDNVNVPSAANHCCWPGVGKKEEGGLGLWLHSFWAKGCESILTTWATRFGRGWRGDWVGWGKSGLSGCIEEQLLLTGTSGTAIQLAAQVSVRPKPCTTGQQKHTFRNSSTWLARGAPPVTISLTRPPSRALILAKTSLSKNGEACSTMLLSR